MVLFNLLVLAFSAALFSLPTSVDAITDYPPGTTVCILPSGEASTSTSDCSTGELYLIGQYVNLGINNVASFGTASSFQSSYHTGKLGFIADYDRNGFASTPAPGFAGDYFATLLPVEGWLTQYSVEGVSGFTYTVSEGLMGRSDTPPSEIHVSSSEGRLSVLWLARFGTIEVRKVIQLQTDQLYFTTSVVVKNIGTKPLTSFYYTRTVDPGQEARFYSTYITRNYVKYQPRSTAGTTAINYEHPSEPNTAMVCAAGVNNADFFLAMGAINSHARVSHFGTQIFQARQAYTDNRWKSFGGNDVTASFADSGRMKTADEAIHLAFYYPSILPGEVVSFQYAHVVHENDLIPALRSLQEVQIVQPTDALTGKSAGISAVIQHSTLATPTACTFSIFAAVKNASTTGSTVTGSARWHVLQTVNSFTESADGTYPVSVNFDSSLFNDGLVQLRVQVNTTLPSLKYYQSKAFVLRNQGLQLCFNTTASTESAPVYFPQASTTRLYLHNCTNNVGTGTAASAFKMVLQSVSFFLETSQGTEVSSTFLSTYTGRILPIQVAITPAHLASLSGGDSAIVRAAVLSYSPALNASFTTTTVYTAMVQAVPSAMPSVKPSTVPTLLPIVAPSAKPTRSPTVIPTITPTITPTLSPTQDPTMLPTIVPSRAPTSDPTVNPTASPTTVPSTVPTLVPTTKPSVEPTVIPTASPSADPSVTPSVDPSVNPSADPSMTPSVNPSADPSVGPTATPSTVPSTVPTLVPSTMPSGTPTNKPSANPSADPSNAPSVIPSAAPSADPSAYPSVAPSVTPSVHPSVTPTANPSANPSAGPSVGPTATPSTVPSNTPTLIPTTKPSAMPTIEPTANPSAGPTVYPSNAPSATPSAYPSLMPNFDPTMNPSAAPSAYPTVAPSADPTVHPSLNPSATPTLLPTTMPSGMPTMNPTADPSVAPSLTPSSFPTVIASMTPSVTPSSDPSADPSMTPSADPSMTPSADPSVTPSADPSVGPSVGPTTSPSADPSVTPSLSPSVSPSADPTVDPSADPSVDPTATPTLVPTIMPSAYPTMSPTASPSEEPTLTPTVLPTEVPSSVPTIISSAIPTDMPTLAPSEEPTPAPTSGPTVSPNVAPSVTPSVTPTTGPSVSLKADPSSLPSADPSVDPSSGPSVYPSVTPSTDPSASPSVHPSASPSADPTADPRDTPSVTPSADPSAEPIVTPSADPSSEPTAAPSATPTVASTTAPSIVPTTFPSVRPSAELSSKPTTAPSVTSTVYPSLDPSTPPSFGPSITPSLAPSTIPSTMDLLLPSEEPTTSPSAAPSAYPSIMQTEAPSIAPTEQPPSAEPSAEPSLLPTLVPSAKPTLMPSFKPSVYLTVSPTLTPTTLPSGFPSNAPTIRLTVVPAVMSTVSPSSPSSSYPSEYSSNQPSLIPIVEPTLSPSVAPSAVASVTPTVPPSAVSSTVPSITPTKAPSEILDLTKDPSVEPTAQPTVEITVEHTPVPTGVSSAIPSTQLSVESTALPSAWPLAAPSFTPSALPSMLTSEAISIEPTTTPTESPIPGLSPAPSAVPSVAPSVINTVAFTTEPSVVPSARPSLVPTLLSSSFTSVAPSAAIGLNTSITPTFQPTVLTSKAASALPSAAPSVSPSASPSTLVTDAPTLLPSVVPTAGLSSSVIPSLQPSVEPTAEPTSEPTAELTAEPSNETTVQPTLLPTAVPSSTVYNTLVPSVSPSAAVTSVPSMVPSTQPTVVRTQYTTLPSVASTVVPTNELTRSPTITTSSNVTAVLIGECKVGYFGLHNDTCTPCIESIRAALHNHPHNINTHTGGSNDIFSQDNLRDANSRGYFPQGFSCPVAGAVHPLASPGWYVQYESVPSLRCSANSQKDSAVCPAAWPCDPPEACQGGNTCSSLYTGERCAECASGTLRINNKCVSCDAVYFGLQLLAVFAIVYGIYMTWNRMCTEVLLRCYIGVDIVQLLSLLSTVTLTAQTSTFMQTALNALTLLNLNPALLTSGCVAVPYFATLDSETKFLYIFVAVNLLPVIIALVLYPVCMCRVAYQKVCSTYTATTSDRVLYDAPVQSVYTNNNTTPAKHMNTTNKVDRALQLHQQCILPSSIPTMLEHDKGVYKNAKYTYLITTAAILSLLYCLLLATSLAVFDCTTTTPDDNYSYLAALGPMVQGRCGVADGVQASLVPYAILNSVVYGLGIPMYLYVVCRYVRGNSVNGVTSVNNSGDNSANTIWSPRQLMLHYFRHNGDTNVKNHNVETESAEVTVVSGATVRAVRWLLCTVIRKGLVLVVMYFTHSTTIGNIYPLVGLAVVVVVLVISCACVGRNSFFTHPRREPKPLVIDIHDNVSEASTVLSTTRTYLMPKVKERVMSVLSVCVTLLVLVLSLVNESTVCFCVALLLVALLCVIVIYALCVTVNTIGANKEEHDELSTPHKHDSAHYRALLGMYGDCEIGEGCSVQEKNNAPHSLFQHSNHVNTMRTPPHSPARPVSTSSTPYNRTSRRINPTSTPGTPFVNTHCTTTTTGSEGQTGELVQRAADPAGMNTFMQQVSSTMRPLSVTRPPLPPQPQLPPPYDIPPPLQLETDADNEESPTRLSARAGKGSYKRARNMKCISVLGAGSAVARGDKRQPMVLPAYMQSLASDSLFADDKDDAMYGPSKANNRAQSKSVGHGKSEGLMARFRRLSLHKDTQNRHASDLNAKYTHNNDWDCDSENSDGAIEGSEESETNEECGYKRYSVSQDHARFSMENPLMRKSETINSQHTVTSAAIPTVIPPEASPHTSHTTGWSDIWPFRWSSADHPTPHTPPCIGSTGSSLPPTPRILPGTPQSPAVRTARHSTGSHGIADVPINLHNPILSQPQEVQQQQRLKEHITRYSAPPAFLTSPERRRRSLTSLFSNKQAAAEATALHERNSVQFRSIRHNGPQPPPPPPPRPLSDANKQSKRTTGAPQKKQLSAHNLQSLRPLHTFHSSGNTANEGMSDEARAFAEYNDLIYGAGSYRHTISGADKSGYTRNQRHKATTRWSKRYKFLRNTHYRNSFNLPAPISYVEYVQVTIDSAPSNGGSTVPEVVAFNSSVTHTHTIHRVSHNNQVDNSTVEGRERNESKAGVKSNDNVNTKTNNSAAVGSKSPSSSVPKRADRGNML